MSANVTSIFSKGFWFGKGIIGLLRLGLFSLFVTFLFISILISAVEHKDINIIINEVGGQILNPLQESQVIAMDIVTHEKIGFFKSIFVYWNFYFNLYAIYLWFSVILGVSNLFLGQTNSPFTIYLAGIFLFLTIAILHSVLVLHENVTYVFTAFKDIGKATVHLFKGIHI